MIEIHPHILYIRTGIERQIREFESVVELDARDDDC